MGLALTAAGILSCVLSVAIVTAVNNCGANGVMAAFEGRTW